MSTLPSDNFRSPTALARFALTMIAGLGLDLATKVWAFSALKPTWIGGRLIGSDVVRVIPGWLEFQLTTNTGAVFGLGEGQRWLFIAVSILAIAFLTFLFARSGEHPWYQVILGLLLAGVLGNMYDRIVFGYVRDMIHVLSRWPTLFPWIFNVADTLLCVGVGLLLLHSFVVKDLHSRK